MTIKSCIGRSEVTDLKHAQFREIVRAHLAIFGAVKNKWSGWVTPTYHYYDTHAGVGVYDDGTLGSPVIFMQEAERAGEKFLARFIEQSSRNCKRLASHTDSRCEITHGEYEHVLSSEKTFDKTAIGLLFCDPNGCFDEHALAAFAKRFPRVDILINVNGSGIKRASVKYGETRIKSKLSAVSKKHWIIRKPYGKWQFSFALGTDWSPMRDKFQKHAMHDIESDAGGYYLDLLERTNGERLQDVQGIPFASALS